jgi:gametolysin peptidase M11
MPNIGHRWAIILCRFADVAATPQPPQYYVDLFTQNGAGGLCDYWRSVTCNAFDLTGSVVYGWYQMSHQSSEVAQLTFPGDRWKLVQWGMDTAQANGVNLGAFQHVLVVQNYGVDHGFAGNGVVIVHQNASLCEFGFISHEMGHGHGLPHSWSANPDFEYGDGWDVMSFATTTFQWPIVFQATQGSATVGLNVRNIDALGAMPPDREWVATTPDFSAALTLDALNQPQLGNHGWFAARIQPSATLPARSSQSAFTVEFRHKAGWDQAIPRDAVLVHEIRTNGLSYLQPGIWSNFAAGDQFVTPDPKVFVRVTAIDPGVPAASVRIWDVPEGCVRKEDSKPKVYLIQNGTKRWVTSPAVLTALGKTWADVRAVPDGGLTSIPDGPDVVLLAVSATPHPVPLNRNVSVTVSAADVSTNTPVQGQVDIDGTIVGSTNVPFSHIFRTRRVRIPNTAPPEWEIVYPTGVVHAAGYPDAPIDFGFPDV